MQNLRNRDPNEVSDPVWWLWWTLWDRWEAHHSGNPPTNRTPEMERLELILVSEPRFSAEDAQFVRNHLKSSDERV